MSITCEACGLSYAGGRGLRGILAQPRRVSRPAVPADARGGAALPPSGARTARGGGDRSAGPHLGRVPRGRGVLRLLRPALRPPAGRLRLVLRRRRRGRLPGPAPVPVPRPPRDAHGARAPRPGAPSSAARRRTSTGWPPGCPTSAAAAPVTSVIRHDDGVDVRTADDRCRRRFDRVVVATHADQALRLLADATPAEKEDLGAITYSVNETWLHRDSSVLPGSTSRSGVVELPADCAARSRRARRRSRGELLDEPPARARRRPTTTS